MSRSQLLGRNWTSEQISAQLRARRWSRLLPGIFLTNTAAPSFEARWWAAHLYGGPNSALSEHSALQAWGIVRRTLPVTLEVPVSRYLRLRCPELRIVRRQTPRPAKEPLHLPPTVKAAHAVLDVCDDLTHREAVTGLITDVARSNYASADSLSRALQDRARTKDRPHLEKLIATVAGGAESVLEVDGVQNILRAHGLPVGRGQVRERAGGKTVIRDREIEEFGIVIEFDGQLGHTDALSQARDARRDNEVALSGRRTIRFTWSDVHDRPCESARTLALMLAQQGWTGIPKKCGPNCRIDR